MSDKTLEERVADIETLLAGDLEKLHAHQGAAAEAADEVSADEPDPVPDISGQDV